MPATRLDKIVAPGMIRAKPLNSGKERKKAMSMLSATRLAADIGVGITGIAGPDGGTAEKPVGLVYLCVANHDTTVARRVILPGGRADVRSRSVVIAMHMIRELLG